MVINFTYWNNNFINDFQKLDINDAYKLFLVLNNKKYSLGKYKALQIAYPGEYEVWQLSRVSKNYWDRETGLKVIKHLIEGEWGYSKEDIKVKLSRKDFVNSGYEYLLDEIFKGDIYGIINEIYPNEFRKNELKGVHYREKKDNLLMSQIKWYD